MESHELQPVRRRNPSNAESRRQGGTGLFPVSSLFPGSASDTTPGPTNESKTESIHSNANISTFSSSGTKTSGGGILTSPDQSYEEENSVFPLFPKINYPSESSIQRTGSFNSNSNVDDFSSWLQQDQVRDEIYGRRRRLSSPAMGIYRSHTTGESFKIDHTTTNTNTSGISSSQNVVNLDLDDAASSVCIDEEDDGTEMRQAIIEVLRGQSRKNHDSSAPLSDFDEYTHRVAREMVIREQAERRMLRQVKDSRKYGNYFSTPNPEEIGTYYTPSHHFDNFNGRRQNIIYNHQLNQLNTPYTYEERQRRGDGRNDQPQEDLVIEEMPEEVSIITLDIDELESDDLSLNDYGNTDETNNTPKLKRKLLSRHVQLLALCGTLGVGTFFNSGQTFFKSGPFGTLLGYVISGLMVLSAMLSLGEMVALLPSDKGINSFASRFVDESLGFALGVCYWFSCVMALPSEVTAASMMISNYPMLDSSNDNSIVVWITFFLVLVLLVNLFDVGVLGELQSLASLAIFFCLILLMIFMAVANSGKVGPYYERVGFRYWDYSKSNFTTHQIYGLFRPSYALDLSVDSATQVTIVSSIGGNLGRFLQVWSAIAESAFSYIGTELVFTTAAEVRNPRKSIPAATKKIFWRILICFCLGIFIVGINVYSGDPRLMKFGPLVFKLHGTASVGTNNAIQKKNFINSALDAAKDIIAANSTVMLASDPSDITAAPPEKVFRCDTTFWSWAGFSGPTSSPWIIALQTIGSCSIAASTNALFIVCALSSAVSHLYAASRTLYGLALQGKHKFWNGFRRCSNAGVPYISVLSSFVLALLAYMTSSATTTKAFEWLVTLCTSAGLLVWAGCCLSFIRFERGLRLRSESIIQRDDEGYPYRSPFQPYTAYFGLFSSLILAIFLGLTLFLRGQWKTGQFFASYSSIFVFIFCFTLHKFICGTKLVPLSMVDLDSGRKEVENIAWEEDRVYSHGLREWVRAAYSNMRYYITTLKMKK